MPTVLRQPSSLPTVKRNKSVWSSLSGLKVPAHINAIDPTEIEGIELFESGKEREGKICFGAIGIGTLKMKVYKGSVALIFKKTIWFSILRRFTLLPARLGGNLI